MAVEQILQTVRSTAVRLVGISEILDDGRKTWSDFSHHVQEHVNYLSRVLPDATAQPPELRRLLGQLQAALDAILSEASDCQKKTTADRIASRGTEEERIAALRDKFDRAIKAFNFEFNLRNMLDSAALNEDTNRKVTNLDVMKVEEMDSTWHGGDDAVHYLLYAQRMSWDPEKICMEGTRTEVIDEAWDFIRSGETAEAAEIFWIVDVAGSGKSAIAHTICQQAKEEGVLLSCFFFDRADTSKNNVNRVVTTLAQDLAALNTRVEAIMSDVIKANPGLRSVSIIRQFQELVLNPAAMAHYPQDRLYTIVFDGVDECCNNMTSLLKLFVEELSRLPGKFRIIVTSRPEDEIVEVLRNQPHIRKRRLQLQEIPSQNDIALYISERLKFITLKNRKTIPWPEDDKRAKLIQKSEGLFLWAVLVMNLLTDCVDPDAELASILSLPASSMPNHAMDTLKSKDIMGPLYSRVLDSLPWNDSHFPDGYRSYMGTVLAAQEPLSCSAMRQLHTELATTQPLAIFRKLGSLVTGVESEDEPVRFLHESIRDFLSRADGTKFHVSQLAASQTLALRCLDVLNRDLPSREAELQLDTLPGQINLGVQLRSRQQVGHALHYSCCYCIDHLVKIAEPTQELKAALQQFLAINFLRWINLSVFVGKFQSLQTLGGWLETHFGRLRPPGRFAGQFPHITSRRRRSQTLKEPNIGCHIYNVELVITLRQISEALYAYDRLEEALLAAQDGTHIVRHPFVMRSRDAEVTAGRMLFTESTYLSAMGRLEEALAKSQDSEKIHRELWRKHFHLMEVLQTWHLSPRTTRSPVNGRYEGGRLTASTHKADVANSLNNMSNRLSALGSREAALSAIEEAVQLRRELAIKRPEAFNADLAGSLNNLSNRLSELGNREAALSAIEEAMKLYRELATKRPEAFNADLADSHNNLSVHLSALGNREAALSAIEEAVKLYRELATKRPEAFNADLAGSLSNLSGRLSALGNREAALSAIEEAVQLRRELATKRPEAFNADLADSLNNLSGRLSALGNREAALSAIEEAVQLRRELATKRPEAFNADLADSLNNLSNRLSELGNREAALSAIEEAVQLRRELATKRPEAFNADLADSLNNLSNRLSELGNREAALSAIEEAVKLYRELATKCPEAFNADLAGSLSNLSGRLSALGNREAALSAIEEAVQLRRELATKRPEAFNADLADSLSNLSGRLSALGNREAALSAIEEAVQLRRELATKRPEAFNADLADSLNNLSNRLSELGNREAALSAIEEAVQLRRELATKRPEAFNADLADSLNNLSNRLSELGNREAALSAIEEAVKLYRELATKRPEAFNADLASSLNNLSNSLSEVGNREAALSAIEEAVKLYRELAAKRPEAFNADLAMAVHNLSGRLSELGNQEAALSAIEEAVKLYRELAAKRPEAFNADLAMAVHNLSGRLSELGNQEAALSAIEEAVKLRRELATKRPEAFNADLASSLNNLSNHLSGLGNREAALSAIEEAVKLYQELAAKRPAAFNAYLTNSLFNLSSRLSDLGRPEEALSPSEEATMMYRELATMRPNVFNRYLKRQLQQLSFVKGALGEVEEARAAAREAEALDVS